MCGLFGFMGPCSDPPVLRALALEASKRGPHAYGLYVDGHLGKAAGQIDDLALGRLFGAKLVIGHCRLATSGDYADLADAQPIVAGGVVVSHNGNIQRHRERARREGVRMLSGCDSELVARLWRKDRDRAVALLEENSPYAVALYDQKARTLLLAASGLPLYVRNVERQGVYYCSRPFTGAVRLNGRMLI